MASTKSLFIPILALALAAPLVPASAQAGGYGNADRLSGYHRGGYGYGYDHRGHDSRRHDGYRHDDSRHDGRRHDDRHYVRRHYVPPRSYVRIWLGDDLALFWSDGFVGPYRHDHLVVAPAIGVRVGHVPAGYVSFVIGPSRYFFVGGAYYVWDTRHRDYLVVPKPKGADTAMRGPDVEREEFFADADRLGPVRDWDRYACDAWASGETGGAERAAPGSPERREYLHNMEACLEDRGYGAK